MTEPTVILAAEAALDVAAARRLAGYGTLDAAGVARALEQVHVQRWGRSDLPGHLRCVARWAAVCVVGGQVTCVSGSDTASETKRLVNLFALDIGQRARLVDWDGTMRDWLLARAGALDIVAPAWLVTASAWALRERLAPAPADHPASSIAEAAAIENECRRLFDPAYDGADAPEASALAASRARLYWRACLARGELTRAARDRRVADLAATDAA